MRLGERILLALSRDPGPDDCAGGIEGWTMGNALNILQRVYPPFARELAGKTVLDFGCGSGWQTVAMAKLGAVSVVGLDSNAVTIAQAKDRAKREGVDDIVQLHETYTEELEGRFDLVISQNSMEHFGDPAAVLQLMQRALRPGGCILLTFGPPWLAPYGSHMHFFTRVPWVNVLFSERTVMAVRGRFRSDGATRYEEVRSGLNRMTLSKFERLVAASGLKPVYQKYDCVKELGFLARVPLLREFGTNHVTYMLRVS